MMGMLFRPEEVHGASGITDIFIPLPEWNSHVCHDAVRLGNLYFPIFNP
jgi:hypothetical protein